MIQTTNEIWFPKNKTIAIYGGSFDPPTLAHVHIASCLANHVDEVWVLPVNKHRIKQHFLGAPKNAYQRYNSTYDERLILCDIAFGGIGNCKVRLLEKYCSRMQPSYDGSTYELLQYLTNIYPSYNFVVAIGQDNAESISEWKHSKELIEEHSFIVYSRGDGDAKLPEILEGNTLITNNKYTDISSTQARDILETVYQTSVLCDNELAQLKTILPDPVIKYIIKKLGE